MGFFYFDESIQDKGGFVIGAFVYSETDLTPVVFDALAAAGLKPGIDEYKSGTRMVARPEQVETRWRLRALLMNVRAGIVVAPLADRRLFGNKALTALKKILMANSLTENPHQVFFDKGIAIASLSEKAFSKGIGALCELNMDQDSPKIGGIQLADLAAHYMGVMLLEHREVPAGLHDAARGELIRSVLRRRTDDATTNPCRTSGSARTEWTL